MSIVTLTETTVQVHWVGFLSLPGGKALQEWLIWHGIDPRHLPLDREIVRGRRTITYDKFVTDENGHRVADDNLNPRTVTVVKDLDRRPRPWPIELVDECARWADTR